MATSGNYNFSLTRDELIKASLRKIRVAKRGFTPGAEDIADAKEALNLIVAQFREKSDGSPSLKMWTRKKVVLFLSNGQFQYSLGPTGDNAVLEDDLVTTTLTAAASGTSLTVASITGISDADFAGVYTSDGELTWTTVNGTPTGVTVVVTDSITAASGATCYFYTSKPQNPVRVLFQNLIDSDGSETPLDTMGADDYWEIGDRDASGTPGNVYIERGRDITDFYFDQAVNDPTYRVRLLVHYPIQSFDATDDNPDFPEQWYRALVWLLAMDLASEYDVQLSQQNLAVAAGAIKVATHSDPENTDLCFEPGRD